MDAVAELGAEDVVDQTVLGDPAQPAEGGAADHGVEMVPVAGDLGDGPPGSSLDPVLQLLWSRGHALIA